MKLAVVFVLAALACSALASNVLTLTDATFDDALKEHDLMLVKFYAPWCGHCKKIAPEFETAADELAAAGDRGVLAKVDCTEEQELAARFGIRGYPTLKLFVNGNAAQPKEYNAERTAAGLVSFLRKKAEPAVAKVDSAEALEELKAKDGSLAVLFSSDADAAATLEAVAADMEHFTFAQADGSLAAAAGGSEGTVTLFRDFADPVTAGSSSTAAELTAFINDNGFPPVVEIGQDSYQRLASQAKPILIVVMDEEAEDRQSWMDILNKLAGEFDSISFTHGPKSGLGRAVEAFGGTGNKFPTAICMKTPALAEDVDNDMNNLPMQFSIDESVELSEESLREFAASIAAGTATAYKKSEPIPEDNSGPVTTLVHANFDDYVKDGNNVFIKFYAPWCGHCKTLAPIWEELGEKFAANENTIIAKLDATANFVDERFDVKGFPTLVFIGADGTEERYNGERDLEALVAFVEQKTAGEHDEL
eukprot:TRINITY_DN5010_c0_g1_i1.p1 TRINITY_DN5010_c0_g1~~TRINITY_DN5010_c0_g1_i1.p1  ORF type:complete len:478 (+),score=195.74 TRINITY_DN5010_c0_g1_i1:32-1465(+)